MKRNFNYFLDRIKRMNDVFKLSNNDSWTNHGTARIEQFHQVLKDEVDELLLAKGKNLEDVDKVALADVLADIIVYCTSEARRWGIPIVEVLHVVMDSQDSKLVDGEPVMAEDGSKFIKGPNYEPPEKYIALCFKSNYEKAQDMIGKTIDGDKVIGCTVTPGLKYKPGIYLTLNRPNKTSYHKWFSQLDA